MYAREKEQKIVLDFDSCTTIELSVGDLVPKLNNQLVSLGTEQDIKLTKDGCIPMDGVQTQFRLKK